MKRIKDIKNLRSNKKLQTKMMIIKINLRVRIKCLLMSKTRIRIRMTKRTMIAVISENLK